MKPLRKKARVILSALILIAFFLPSFQGVSGFQFISVASAEAANNRELTQTDVFILLVPLILVPVTAFGIGLVSWLRMSIRKTFTVLPLLCLFSFIVILFMSAQNGSPDLSRSSVFLQMGVGFYLALLASACIPFTKNPEKKKIKRKRSIQIEPAV